MKIGFIGLGAMGAPMAKNLLGAGFDLTVHNRSPRKEEELAALGARRAGSPAEAADDVEVLITMVGDTGDVEDVLFGPHGATDHLPAGAVVVDMSTIDPEASVRFAITLGERGVGFVDAPVSGGTEGAEKASLSIMCGGTERDVDRVLPVLKVLGTKITHIGGPGSGQLAKAINQVIIAGTFLAVGEGVALGLKAGLDMDKVLDALGSGAASSWVLANRARRMIDHDYPLGFKVRLHRKDLRIASQVAERLEVDLKLAAMVGEIEDRLIEAGLGDADMSALARAPEGLIAEARE